MAQLAFDFSEPDCSGDDQNVEPELNSATLAEQAHREQNKAARDVAALDVPALSKRSDPIANPLRFALDQLQIDVFSLARLLKTSATHATDWLQRGCWPESPSARQHLIALANEHNWDLGYHNPPPEPMLPLF